MQSISITHVRPDNGYLDVSEDDDFQLDIVFIWMIRQIVFYNVFFAPVKIRDIFSAPWIIAQRLLLIELKKCKRDFDK